ncbi:MAG: DUF4886 domain-containing protein [Ruminococcaceae bacterium]|nr:DUF4886 domain-containing protein [Oscillospiraceae bacterium]
MQVLAIGNSFSSDATRYLHRLARKAGEKLTVVNLYIGGCSLERHYRNMLSEECAYELQINGEASGFKVSLKEALLNRSWNVIAFQQASPSSPKYETYQPYLTELSAYVRRLCPKARQVIHQTWAYERDSERLTVLMGYERPEQMTADIVAAYHRAAETIGADAIIPSGELMAKMLANGMEKVHRDTYHASLGAGRYALALLWYGVLTGKDVSADAFDDFDVEVTPAEREIVIRSVCELLKKQ